MAEARPFQVELRPVVRTYDIDFAGIVSNIVYIRWLEDLRFAVLHEYFPLDEQLARGVTPVLLSTDIQYLRTIRLFQQPIARMWIADVGRVKWTVEAEIVVEDVVSASARQTLATINLGTLRPLPVSSRFRQLFQEHRDPR